MAELCIVSVANGSPLIESIRARRLGPPCEAFVFGSMPNSLLWPLSTTSFEPASLPSLVAGLFFFALGTVLAVAASLSFFRLACFEAELIDVAAGFWGEVFWFKRSLRAAWVLGGVSSSPFSQTFPFFALAFGLGVLAEAFPGAGGRPGPRPLPPRPRPPRPRPPRPGPFGLPAPSSSAGAALTHCACFNRHGLPWLTHPTV